MFAIEKNKFAVYVLHQRNSQEWGERVTIVSTDMRKWNSDKKADIIVSELLGSFGDNELSPECLFGANDLLKVKCNYRSHGVLINRGSYHREPYEHRF